MRVGIVKSIAAMLLGSSFAMAQGPMTSTGKTMSRTAAPARAEKMGMPLTSTQQGYLSTSHGMPEGAPEENGHGAVWEAGFDNFYRFYGSAEWLIWNIENPSLPSLTTAIPAGIAVVPQVDVVDNVPEFSGLVFLVPVTVSSNPNIPDANSVEMGHHNGMRLTGGVWFDDNQDCGFELSGFWLEQLQDTVVITTQNVNNVFTLDTGITAGVFITELDTNGQPRRIQIDEVPIVIPSRADSTLISKIDTELWGTEANFRRIGFRVGSVSVGGLLGLRYIDFQEDATFQNNVNIDEFAVDAELLVDPNEVLPIVFLSRDEIRAENRILAPQVGVDIEGSCGRFFYSARGKVAVGANFQELEVFGATVVATPAGVRGGPGGMFSGPLDQGEHERTRISVVPEINLKLGYALGDWLRLHIGYDALFLNNVLRASNQTSLASLTTQIQVAESSTSVGVDLPVIRLRDADVWIQGINFGAEIRY